MPRTDAFYEKHAIFINAGLIACHANHDSDGFRQKDLKFYIELLSNWMETSFNGHSIEVKNTQIQRLMDSMATEGILKKEVKNKNPIYSFSSIGILEVTTRLVDEKSLQNLQNFFFLYHFVSFYSRKLEDLIIGGKHNIPRSYQLEIKHLLDAGNLVEQQKQRLKLEMSKLKDRIDEAHKMTNLAQGYLKKGESLSEVISKVEGKYPYQLNNQKRMTELFKSLSPDVQLMEISEAPAFRAQTLWEPLLLHYQNYVKILDTLS